MFYQIVSFVLDVVVGLLGGACLLRLYMQTLRVPFNNPIGRVVFALSDWLVLPLRRVLPAWGRWDSASLAAALLLELAQYLVLWLLAGAGAGALALLPLLAGFGLLRLLVSGLIGLILVYTVLSWLQPHAPLVALLDRLCEPALRPFRRWIPLIGGIDLAPLALLVVLQVAMMLVGHLQFMLLSR